MGKNLKLEQLKRTLQFSKMDSEKISLPIIVAAKDIEKVVVGYSAKTAANDRCRKRGPRYFMVGGRPYYQISDLVEHFTKNPVETTD